jgi:Ca2+-binding EF-hand superfamily protein
MKKGLKMMPHLKDLVITEEQWDKFIEAMDSNGDAKIYFNEFLATAFDRKKLLSKENI